MPALHDVSADAASLIPVYICATILSGKKKELVGFLYL